MKSTIPTSSQAALTAASVAPPRKCSPRVGACWNLLALLYCMIFSAAAQELSGDFYYTDEGSTVTIYSYIGIGGAVSIPASIIGKPVTAIGSVTK